MGTLEAEAAEAKEEIGARARELDETLAAAEKALRRLRDQSVDAVETETASLLTAAGDDVLLTASDAEFAERRAELEARLAQVLADAEERLSQTTLRLQRAVSASLDGSREISAEEATELLEEEVLELREQAAQDFELSQLGMATQVVSHELDAAITSVRDGLRRLRAWADVNPDLGDVYEDIRTAFEHLDGYLTLFTPLQRRLRRRRETLSGPKIERFLRRLFERRLEEDGIELQVTERFRKWSGHGYRSVLYPVLINLVDNATYWVRQKRGDRWIRLDADGSALEITDSGPGVPGRDRQRIWEFGFTRKPGGRGAGLHISRQVLEAEGGYIDVVEGSGDEGARFRVELPEEEKE